MLRPFRGYAAVARRPASRAGWLWVRGPLKWLLVVAAFVSFTTAGRLLWYHLLLSPTAWAFGPALQIGWLLAAHGLVARGHERRPVSRAELVDWFFLGQGPWLALLLGLSGLCLLSPDILPAARWLVTNRLGLGLVLGVLVWSLVLTLAFFRAALGLGRGRSALATAIYYLGYAGTLAAYYQVTGQLAPLFGVYL